MEPERKTVPPPPPRLAVFVEHAHGNLRYIGFVGTVSLVFSHQSAHATCVRSKTHHGEEEIQRDQRGLGGVTERKAEALAQFRGQAERAE